MAANNIQHVVVIGGGMIGTSTCYYLMKRWTEISSNSNSKTSDDHVLKITLIERTSIACHASGKAGGFLARDWCDSTKTGPLARKSFELHRKLGNEFGNDKILYREMKAYEMKTETKTNNNINMNNIDTQWLDCNIDLCNKIAKKQNGAQCHPKYLCHMFVESCQNASNNDSDEKGNEKGSEKKSNDICENFEFNIVYGNVTNLLFDKNNEKAIAIEYLATKSNSKNVCLLECNDVVLALGPWTHLAYNWFPKQFQNLDLFKQISKISGSKHNSIVLKLFNSDNKRTNLPNNVALFLKHKLTLESENGNKKDFIVNCEVYPRPDNTIYVCEDHGSRNSQLPNDASLIKNDDLWSVSLHNTLLQLMGNNANKNDELIVKQACFVPSTGPNGVPLIGKLPNIDNIYIGAGHSCWGILNGPATGKILSQLILDGKVSLLTKNEFDAFNPRAY